MLLWLFAWLLAACSLLLVLNTEIADQGQAGRELLTPDATSIGPWRLVQVEIGHNQTTGHRADGRRIVQVAIGGKIMIRPGLEPGISGSGGRRLIHWANGPCATCANCANAVLYSSNDAEWRE